MMTQEENEILTRVGPGTPMGELLRRYWQPAALSEDLPPGGPPKPVRHLGEDLVLFRDDKGRVGLLGIHCSHRGTNLSYGRLEDGGLRCIYHGWLYDIHGRCLEQPGEPNGGSGRDSIRHLAYPCKEIGGLIFTYMGPGDPPLIPEYEALTVPDDRRAIRKYFQECNYLQANEGNIDPMHLSFLHRQFSQATGYDRRQGLGVRGTEVSPDVLYTRDVAPSIEVEVTDFGVRIFSIRRIAADKNYLRVSNFVLPNLSAIPGETGGDGYSMNWHVPIDNTHHWKYIITFRRSAPIDKELFRKRTEEETTPDYRLIRSKSDRYLQDREEMKSRSFSGMGSLFAAHDVFATESQGPIQDRTQEHLVSSDKAIIAARKLLLKGIKDIQEGHEAPHIIRDPKSNRFPHLMVISEVIPSSMNAKDYIHGMINASTLRLGSGQAGSA